LTVFENGFGKRTDFNLFPIRHRGAQGVIAAKPVEKSGKLATARAVGESTEVIISSRNGVVIRIKCADIRKCGRSTTGVKVMTMDNGDTVVDVAPVEE
jgi:DNA gyrase subunit A